MQSAVRYAARVMNERKTVGSRWLWLGAPLLVASAGWATVPQIYAATGIHLEGALAVAYLVGILSTALTAPVAILVLAAIQRRRPLSMPAYVATLIAVATPALAFEALVLSASAMGAFLAIFFSNFARPGEVAIHLLCGATFIILYTTIGIASYPFARRGIFPAAIPAVASGAAILGWVAYRVLYSN